MLQRRIDNYYILNLLLALLIFSIVADPSNVVLKIKDISFLLIVGVTVFTFKSYNKNVLYIILGLFIVFLGSVFWGILRNYDFDKQILFAYTKGWMFYLLLLIVPNKRISLFDKLILPCVIISIIIILIYIRISINPDLLDPIREYIFDKYDQMIKVNKRWFLNRYFYGVYYKTTPILILPLAYFANLALTSSYRRKRRIILSILFFVALMMSGTRASMFSAFFVVGFLIVLRMLRKTFWRILLWPLLLVFLFFSINLLSQMFGEKQEYSINVKMKHWESQKKLLGEHPDILLFGQGPGSIYYTSGFKDKTSLTELSYIEIIRMFGLFGGLFIFFFHFFPIYIIYKNKPPNYFAFLLGYISYLFIAGTNPLILNSFGNIVVFTAYSYGYTNDKVI